MTSLPRWNGTAVDDAYERALCARIASELPADDSGLFDTRAFRGQWRAGRPGTAFLDEMGRLRRGARRQGDRRGSDAASR